jgi:ABC-type multidrug transport system ATPase subunit
LNPLLQVEHLSKRFGDYRALADISFEVKKGEILGLIGPNGAGKTTLMECLAGLLPYDSGLIRWQDQQLSPARQKSVLFYLPDNVLPYGEQYVVEILDFFRQVYGLSHEQQKWVVEQLALKPVLKKRINTLSKGYRRRFLLAIALLSPQPLLILDEPFDGFDLRQTQGVMSGACHLCKGKLNQAG